ncbi:ATP-dependent RNA helicase HrpA [Advenella sp. RU8]|uniref:ATP-dependent RNA helicase HrpA n=1 Tax=Advenella sp. RU8 TaxID=3399575 RepID=UPI003AB07293
MHKNVVSNHSGEKQIPNGQVPVRLPPSISYPEDLPVSAKRAEIAKALQANQVVIVCGETGSGKTTQLPKICLELGRGLKGMIGHTQPRRLAATSVAKRIAQELNTPLGEWVGYQIRFSDKTGPGAAIKLMTDGILLAESQRDPLLRRYDTIIIDEAHERSLNIDFLLGFLKQLLPRRKDLKLIITSATIDADRFATHFAGHNGKKAPVIEVSGRLYPVEVRYRPIRFFDDEENLGTQTESSRLERDEEKDLIDGIVDAVDECAQHGPGDILVFLPGEREIREAAESLRKHHPSGTMVLPLFARMSQADQERIFHPSTNQRRVILATNVAETSLTVPGIRFVIDSGLARVKRYSWRNKVEQLQIEPISQASANQRAGRCGRIGPGVCIRLYDEDDFKLRTPFTDPEILRSSLASVILRMKALRLDEIEQFPFVDMPSGKAIADGYHLLQELGAIDETNKLTPVGRSLASLPVDPRLARMILAAKEHQCLDEMLVIASALSIQDPRERPFNAKEASDQAHAKFKDEKSEFISYLKLWSWYNDAVAHKVSQRKLVEKLRTSFLSPLRLREWHDVHTQLHSLVREQGWRLNQTEATYEQIHKALLTGLLGNLGFKSDEAPHFMGAREIRFFIHPGSSLVKKAGKWIVAAELVETSRLFARCIAKIDPRWIESIGSHLLKKQWSDPAWNAKLGQVQANERASLYGLQIYHGRKVHYGRIAPAESREIFIRDALVAGDIDSKLPFIVRNNRLIREIEKLEHKARRPDILVDDGLIFAFYDKLIPEHIYQVATLESWYKELPAASQEALVLNRDDLMRHEATGVTTDVFPKKFVWDGIELALDYHFEPGSPRDGVTMTIPVYALNQIDATRCQWLVPGMLKEKVHLLLKSLPQKLRRHCVPLPDYASGFHQRWFDRLANPGMALTTAIAEDIWAECKVRVKEEDFKIETLPVHLFMNFKVIDEHGRMLSAGRNLNQLKAEHGMQAQETFQRLASKDREVAQVLASENIIEWSFGQLPELLEIKKKNQSFIGYPALVDNGVSCDLDVFDDPEAARQKHQAGLLRLFRIALKDQLKFLSKNITDLTRMSMIYMPLGSQEDLRDQIVDCALMQACLTSPLPEDANAFEQRRQDAKGRLGLLIQEIARLAGTILAEWATVQKKLPQIKSHKQAYEDITGNLSLLMSKDFLKKNPYAHLVHFPRYLKACSARMDKLRSDPARDARMMADMAPLLLNYQRMRSALKGAPDERLDDFQWLLQELRVALFAQELRTPMPVSVKRLQKAWETIIR